MKSLFSILTIGILVMSCNQAPKQASPVATQEENAAAATPARDGVFIHITAGYDDPHRALMPLKMATIMATDKDVLVYLDIHAVELVKKDAKDLSFAEFESARTYIKKLIELNVGVYACPTCMKVAGMEPGDLMDGVQVAQKDKFFSFTKGRILALDY
jgi:predicted peroxiredoxin